MADISIDISSNIDDIKNKLDEVAFNIEHDVHKRLDRATYAMFEDVKQNIVADPMASGNLIGALHHDTSTVGTKITSKVYIDGDKAPYAPVVEFGSGERKEQSMSGSIAAQPPSQYPPDWPFHAPDISNMQGFAYYIRKWMDEKGIIPEKGSLRASSLAIARTIDEKGTYAHPFMRPGWFSHRNKIRLAIERAVRGAV